MSTLNHFRGLLKTFFLFCLPLAFVSAETKVVVEEVANDYTNFLSDPEVLKEYTAEIYDVSSLLDDPAYEAATPEEKRQQRHDLFLGRKYKLLRDRQIFLHFQTVFVIFGSLAIAIIGYFAVTRLAERIVKSLLNMTEFPTTITKGNFNALHQKYTSGSKTFLNGFPLGYLAVIDRRFLQGPGFDFERFVPDYMNENDNNPFFACFKIGSEAFKIQVDQERTDLQRNMLQWQIHTEFVGTIKVQLAMLCSLIICGLLTKRPKTAQGYALFIFSPIATALYSWVMYVYENWYSGMVKPLQVLMESDFRRVFADPLEEQELAVVDNQQRLYEGGNPARWHLLVEKLLDARKYPKSAANVAIYVDNVLKIPTYNEINAQSTTPKTWKDVEASFSAYAPDVKKQAYKLFERHLKGVKLPATYLVGEPGVGKTYMVELLVNAWKGNEGTTSNVGEVRIAGADVRELMGWAPSGTDPGEPGLILRTIMEADGVLFIDEIDKALLGEHGKEVSNLLLEFLESSNEVFFFPYLGSEEGLQVDLPKVIMTAGNTKLEDFPKELQRMVRPLKNRLTEIYLPGFPWDTKMKIISEKIPAYCKRFHINPTDFKTSHKKALMTVLEEKREILEKDPGMREVERETLETIEDMVLCGELKTVNKNKLKSHGRVA